MTIEMKLPFEQEDIRSLSAQNNEPTWLTELRVQAFSDLENLPMPKPDKTKIDKWNFTSFRKHSVESEAFTSLDELPETLKSIITLEKKNLYIQRNHTPAYRTLSAELTEQGVIFTDILTAARDHAELVQKYFMTDGVQVNEHRLTALHTALLNGGVFLYVPKNVEIKEPLQAIFLIDDADTSLFNHVLVVAEENSSVTYVENYFSAVATTDGVANIITEVITKDNANVTYGAVDTLDKGYTTYVNRCGVAGRDARIEWALGLMNDGNTISDNTTHLVGDGSSGDTKTVVVGRGEQKQNFTTQVIHYGQRSEGNILMRGVVKDSASNIFNGIGKIEHGATKADAQQESRVLMLSEKARGDANPMLLIDEDDVVAGHAASVGRVDPTQLYYLMSRGISRTEAERLVIHGFLAPVVKALPIEGVKKQLVEIIERKVTQ